MKEENIPIPCKVMIIEDEQDICYLLSSVLKQNNLQTACVNTLTEAKENLEEIKPAIIFIDNNLPDGSGYDLIPLVKNISPFTKIVMITAHDDPGDINAALKSGADIFISKPFNTENIRNTIRSIKTNRA